MQAEPFVVPLLVVSGRNREGEHGAMRSVCKRLSSFRRRAERGVIAINVASETERVDASGSTSTLHLAALGQIVFSFYSPSEHP